MSRRANGEGTIFQRADGRWSSAAYVCTTDGLRRRVTVYGKSRTEVADKLSKLITQDRQGIPQTTTSQTVGDFLEYWLEHVVLHQVRPLTFRGYEMYVRRHLKPGLGSKRLSRLSARDVRLFLDSKRATPSGAPAKARARRPLSSRTVAHLHAILRNALEHAVREDLLTRNVARQVRITVGYSEAPEPLSVEEARKLLDAARDDRLFALYALCLGLGLRRGEALGLRWSDIDLDDGVVKIGQTLQRHHGSLHFEPPKTARSRRSIAIPDALLAVLRQHAAKQPDAPLIGLVFTNRTGQPIEPNDFSKAFARLCKTAGVRHVRLHDLRHTCATFLLAQGVPPRTVMEILGHSSLDVTMNIYGHVMLEMQRDALRHVDPLLGGPSQ